MLFCFLSKLARNTVIVALLTLVSTGLFSQDSPCFSSREAIQKGIEFHDLGQYNDAIPLFREVQQGDTLYGLALYEEGLSLIASGSHSEAIEPLKMSLDAGGIDRVQALINLGIAYDYAGELDQSLAFFAQAEKEAPFSNMVHFNRAVTLIRAGRGDEALVNLQRSAVLNPAHPGTHLRLGYLAAANGAVTQAALSLHAFLTIEPTGERAYVVLQSLEGILSGTYVPEDQATADMHPNGLDDFEELDLVLQNQISFRDTYKYPLKKVDLKVLRQTHLLLNEFVYNADDKGFWMQTYGPVVTGLKQTNRVNDFLLLMVANLQSYEKELAKRMSSVKSCLEFYTSELNANAGRQELPTAIAAGSKRQVNRYNDGTVANVVEMENGQRNGQAEFYFGNGQLQAIGGFKDGERHGEWRIYYSSGVLEEELDYDSGLIDGMLRSYTESGVLVFEGEVTRNKLNGRAKYFDDNGWLTVELAFKDGEPNGERVSYFQNGQPSKRSTYVNGVEQGAFTVYHPNGDIAQEGNFVDGELDAVVKSYYSGMRLESEGRYINGTLDGEYKAYYPNGTLKERSESKDGRFIGTGERFHANGKLSARVIYDASTDETALYEYYDYNGVKIEEQDVVKGELRGFRQFADDGSILVENKKKGGKLNYIDYSGDGILLLEGEYDANNSNRVGLWKTYDSNGALEYEHEYENGKRVGQGRDFYANGAVRTIANYREGEYHGAYTTSYLDGAKETVGCYTRGLAQGEWLTYHEDGETVYSRRYFVDGEINGVTEYYGFDGKLTEQSWSRRGQTYLRVRASEAGSLDTIYTFSLGTYTLEVLYPDGGIQSRISYSNGAMNGIGEWFYPNGKLFKKGARYNDEMHGEWIHYHPNGKVYLVENYEFGKLNGKRTYYDEEGRVETEYEYMLGKLNGQYAHYFGTTQVRSGEYVNGDVHGVMDYYSLTGKLQMRRIYYHDRIRQIGHPRASETTIVWVDVQAGETVVELTFANGRPSRRFGIRNGELHGPLTIYNENGSIQHETAFSYGVETGRAVSYYPDGKLYEEELYLNGDLHGEKRMYYSNGKLMSVVEWKHGVRDGEAIHYDRNGKEVAHLVYKTGNLVSKGG